MDTEEMGAEIVFEHRAVIFNVNVSAPTGAGVYEAVQAAWRINPRRASMAELVLAQVQGVVVGVFLPSQWLPATEENFPNRPRDERTDKRWGFVGLDAPPEIARIYMEKRLPATMRKRGSANPVRYSY